ncbi:hypothetical protein VRK_28070 [Vibrio sp. MEBiC08052]|nr:hypothetical protein VRK_28070 [Vibrio sp. MEBiC08052]
MSKLKEFRYLMITTVAGEKQICEPHKKTVQQMIITLEIPTYRAIIKV